MMTGASPSLLPTHATSPGLYAGFWLRVVAYFIDGLVLAPVFAAFYLALGGSLGWPWPEPGGAWSRPASASGWWLAWVVIPWLYFAGCESSELRATPGKLALGLRVTDACGRRIGFARATGRFFGKFVSGIILDIGYLLAAWTARKQALHDLLADCCVVRKSGLAAWQQAPVDSAPAARPAGMPGWAIGLVAAACLVLLLPVAGAVSLVAIPLYRYHAVRTEVAQGVDLTQRARALVGEFITQRGNLPNDNRALGLPLPEAIHARYVVSVGVMEGKVVVTYGNDADARISGGHVVFSPVGDAARLRWQCSSPDIRDAYLPSGCR
ncbi:MAG TPA: RDD family protein [Rhodanobacter sp.]|nr:RDD family protein [Rhodanobacter sp.]